MPKRTREQRLALASRKKKIYKAKHAFKTKVNHGNSGVTALTRPPRSIQPVFGGPIGQTFESQLSYAGYFTMDPSAGAPTSYLFHANGLYDPDHTGIGHQPHGFDQIMALYKNYQVLSSTIEATVFPQLSEGSLTLVSGSGSGVIVQQLQGSWLGIAVRDTATTMTGLSVGPDAILERPNVKAKFINSNSEPCTIRASWSMPQWYGKTKGLDDVESTGSQGTNPTEGIYYHIMFGPPDGSTNLASHKFVARISFKCRFFNPVDVSQS